MSTESIKERLARLANAKSVDITDAKAPSSTPVVGGSDSKAGSVANAIKTPPVASASVNNTPTTGSLKPSSKRKLQPARKLVGTLNTKAIAAATPATPTPEPSLDSILDINKDMEQLEGFDPEEFTTKLQQLSDGLEIRAPGLSNYLQKINTNLNKYPELAHILNDEQLSTIVSGLLFLTNTNMAEAVTKKGSRGTLSIDESAAMF